MSLRNAAPAEDSEAQAGCGAIKDRLPFSGENESETLEGLHRRRCLQPRRRRRPARRGVRNEVVDVSKCTIRIILVVDLIATLALAAAAVHFLASWHR